MDIMNTLGHSAMTEEDAQGILNFLAIESIEIVTQELDYFFSNKEKMAELFIETIGTAEIKACILNKFLIKCFSPGEQEALIVRIEKQIKRQIGITQGVHDFSLYKISEPLLNELDTLNGVREEVRTLKLNLAVVKLIDIAWKNTCQAILPLELGRLTSRYKPGQHILASLGVSPREIRENIKVKWTKRLKGALRQHKTELSSLLTKEIIRQFFTQAYSGNVNTELIKTA